MASIPYEQWMRPCLYTPEELVCSSFLSCSSLSICVRLCFVGCPPLAYVFLRFSTLHLDVTLVSQLIWPSRQYFVPFLSFVYICTACEHISKMCNSETLFILCRVGFMCLKESSLCLLGKMKGPETMHPWMMY